MPEEDKVEGEVKLSKAQLKKLKAKQKAEAEGATEEVAQPEEEKKEGD